MKKLFILAAAALIGTAAFAQDVEDLRIYINPGHGAWTSSDRPMATLRQVNGLPTVFEPGTLPAKEANTPDTTCFYESNTNLRKCLALLDRLVDYGFKFDRTLNQTNSSEFEVGAARDFTNNIVMSHVRVGPYPHDPNKGSVCSKNLSTIAAEANYGNFDMFISVHSNASSSDGPLTNYVCFLYRGLQGEGGDRASGSRDMCYAAWPYAFANGHQPWTARKKADDGVLGDVSFYHEEVTSSQWPGYLGALRHAVPGYLVEGYFHTYQPSRCRAMNFDADRIEGIQYARGVADYFGLEKENTGEIYGIIRDKHQKFSHNIYRPLPSTNDVYLPINGATVTLSRDGKVVKEVVTDNHYNGSFVFMNLEPGEYTLSYSHPDYKEADEEQPLTVTVEAATTIYPEVFLENVNFRGDGEGLVDYPDAVLNAPVGLADEYILATAYADRSLADLADLDVRRMIVRGEYAYVLAVDDSGEPTVGIYNVADGKLVRLLDTDGVEGDILPLSDIALTSDGRLIGANSDILPFDGDDLVYIYAWENADDNLPDGSPETIIAMNHAGNWTSSEFGQSIAFTGTLDDGILLMTNKKEDGDNVRIEAISIKDSEEVGHWHMKLEEADVLYNAATMGNWQISIAPDNSSNFILTSTGMPAAEFAINRESAGVPTFLGSLPEGLIEGTGYRAGFMRYAGEALMVAPTAAPNACTGLALIRITDGMANAELVATTNTQLAGDAAAQAVAGTVSVKRDSGNRYQKSWINLLALRGSELTRLTTDGVDQPKHRANFAYDLACTQQQAEATITFKATGDALNAALILESTTDEDDVLRIDLGAASAGENTFTVDLSNLTVGSTYNWSIELQSRPIGESTLYFTSGYNPAKKNNSRGGVVVIDDPEQASYGKVIVAYGYAQGIEVWNPDLTLQGVYHKDAPSMTATGVSLFRGAQYNGKAVFTDWNDKSSGYWLFDPEAPEALTNMIQGENNGTGAFVYNGAVIGGGSTGLSFYGSGDDTKLYTFVEDYPTGNSGKVLARYDIGSAETIVKAPDYIWDSKSDFNSTKLLSSANVDVLATDKGVWVSQVIGAGLNKSTNPAFALIGNDGMLKYNVGDYDYLITGCGSGLAVNADNSLMAVSDPGNMGISIYEIIWMDDEPVLYRLYSILAPANTNEHTQMRFDPANNLHVFTRGTGYQMFVLKNSSPKATTPAPTASTILGSESGIEAISAPAHADAAPIYYNLQGQRIASPAAGQLYIEQRGNVVRKAIMK